MPVRDYQLFIKTESHHLFRVYWVRAKERKILTTEEDHHLRRELPVSGMFGATDERFTLRGLRYTD
jgi:hypothetical protein